MTGWKEEKLENIFYIVKEVYKPSNEHQYKYVGLEHIEQGTLRLNGWGYSNSVQSNKYFFKKDDILFGKLRPYFRKVIKAPFDGVCSTDIWVCRAKKDFDQNFLFYFLANQEFIDTANSTDEGTRMPRADWNYLKKTTWIIPPLPEQKAIAEVLSSFDDKINLLTRQNKTLEDLAQTYFRKWFIEDSAKSRTVQISDIIDFNPPRYLAKGTIAPYLEMANVSTSVFHPDDWYNREYSSGTKFVNGDTLFARITPCLENGKSTYVTFLNKGQVGWGSTEFIVMHTKNDLHPFLSYLLTKNEEFRDHAESCLEGSSGRQRVNIDHLLNFKIQVPNEKIAQTFNLIMEDIVLKLHHNFMQIRTLSKLRDILLPKLISGEIRVKM